MSDNTVINIVQRLDNTWRVTRHWYEDDMVEVGNYRMEFNTFDDAMDYAESLGYAEYGIQISRERPPVVS